MIPYIPRERFLKRDPIRRNMAYDPDANERWQAYKKYGAVYDLEKDTTRAATVEEFREYKREKKNGGLKSFKIFPDDYLGKPDPGRGPALPKLDVGDRVNHWTVVKIATHPLRYLCECDCEHKTRTWLKPSTLIQGYSQGCIRCAGRRHSKMIKDGD